MIKIRKIYINFPIIIVNKVTIISKKVFKINLKNLYSKSSYKNKFQTKFVNKYGIAYSCDFYPKKLISDISFIDPKDYQGISSGSVVYVIASALKDWFQKIYPRLLKENKSIILVTGDSVRSNPLDSMNIDRDKFNQIMDEGIIYHWFCQNCDIDLEEYVTPIPVGIDYHTINRKNFWGEFQTHYIIQDLEINYASRNRLNDFKKRKYDLFCDIHLNPSHKKERKIAYEKSKSINNAYFVDKQMRRGEYWIKMRRSKFIVSPRGVGIDCHRSWEAIALGVVPIIKSSNLSSIFEELPVLIVDSFEDLNDSLLRRYKLDKKYDFKKLTLQYWIDLIEMKKISIKPNSSKDVMNLINKKNLVNKYSINFKEYICNFLSKQIIRNPFLLVMLFIYLIGKIINYSRIKRILKFFKRILKFFIRMIHK